MKKLILISVLFVFVAAPVSLLAMDHGKMDHDKMEGMDHSKMDHGKMEGMDHSKMDHSSMNHDGMMMLGTQVVEGVKASAQLKDTSAAMSKMGMAETHHLMVFFVNNDNNNALAKGVVAVKVKGPDDKEAKPVKLMGMGDGFGADLALKEKGSYHFYVGTKLEDGVKRQFYFETEMK